MLLFGQCARKHTKPFDKFEQLPEAVKIGRSGGSDGSGVAGGVTANHPLWRISNSYNNSNNNLLQIAVVVVVVFIVFIVVVCDVKFRICW